MRFYTVHVPPPGSGRPVEFLRSGFSWMAALFAPFWLLWHRLWLGFAVYVALSAVFGLAAEWYGLADAADLLIGAALAFLTGAEAAAFRRWMLARRGWRLDAVVAARSAEEAEWRWRNAQIAAPPPRPPAPAFAPMPAAGAFPRLV